MVAIALILASFIYSVLSGDRSWRVGVSASVLCLAVIFAVALYATHYARALERLQGKPSIRQTPVSARDMAVHLESLVSGSFQRRGAAMVIRYREIQRAKQQ